MDDLDSIAELGSKLGAELGVKLDCRHPASTANELTGERTSPRADLDNKV